MTIASQLFSKLLPKEGRFFTGENPSPSKLNGIFKQLESAFGLLESFLGNGIDYHITEDKDRKMMFNISSAIGRTDKLYKPINLVPSLQFINNIWGNDVTSFADGILSFSTDLLFLTIPVNAMNNYEFGILYKGRGKILGLDGTDNWDTTSLPLQAEYKWKTISVSSNKIKFFKLKKYAADTDFNVRSIYIIDKSLYSGVYNKAYSLPLTNNVYWTNATPCKYSDPNGDQKCEVKTCNYCIGQTYSIDKSDLTTYGKPICVSKTVDSANGAYWDNTGTPISISYSPEVTGDRASYLTLQCPILTVDNQYAIKYKSFHVHSETLDTELPTNSCIIYDTKNSSATIKYLTKLYSAGGIDGSIRGDIVYINNKTEISAGEGDSKRFMILGSDYGLLDLMYDIMLFVNLPVPNDSTDQNAVYDE